MSSEEEDEGSRYRGLYAVMPYEPTLHPMSLAVWRC
jgi:hypothetical protein